MPIITAKFCRTQAKLESLSEHENSHCCIEKGFVFGQTQRASNS